MEYFVPLSVPRYSTRKSQVNGKNSCAIKQNQPISTTIFDYSLTCASIHQKNKYVVFLCALSVSAERRKTSKEFKMKTHISNYNVLKETISQNNVLAMAEQLAMYETRFLIGYMGSRMQKMYADLCVDIKRKTDVNHTFSDSYDLVQECVLFLCNHYGKRLNDILAYDKNGKAITVKIACIRTMSKLITRKTSDYFRFVSFDALTSVSEPSYEIKEEIIQDYTVYDTIIESLNLTENMRIALECRQSGLSYPEIGKVLSRAQATVFEYFIKMRKRYTAIYG